MSSLPQRRSRLPIPAAPPATIASVSSSDPTRFIINATGSTQIAAGATDTSWTIQPAANLAAGTYGATVTVTYDGGKTVSSTCPSW